MKRQKLIDYVESLEVEQLRKVCIESIEYLLSTTDVRFPEGAKRPYWESCGESLDGSDDVWEEDI